MADLEAKTSFAVNVKPRLGVLCSRIYCGRLVQYVYKLYVILEEGSFKAGRYSVNGLEKESGMTVELIIPASEYTQGR